MDEIIKYFTEEKKETPVVARILEKPLVKYEDIRDAFLDWLVTRDYTDTPIVREYTPQKIHELNPGLDASGVYQFLVTLRDNPDKAEEYIKNNFSTK
ncbi:hypothetical protein SAMN04487770_12958 [Butyrivibrio sp. ob235]|uniref:hypothetical protein n=1 Tax=Butyrivibrio sp. ob235 TaxID=1761780 RepID=UPI0008D476F4|nr:hypothetical protein [Butyrivibrio sp. ob235]SEM23192.1 hypothetical protein SAMN04487770_12958 [Butyrivibrio sp. ob235]